jgi:hypothetical protein
VTQAFDKVWHKGLNCKLRTILPKQYAEILESYLTESFFRIKQGDTYSELNTLRTGDAILRFYITTVQDGWRKSAFLTRAFFPAQYT